MEAITLSNLPIGRGKLPSYQASLVICAKIVKVNHTVVLMRFTLFTAPGALYDPWPHPIFSGFHNLERPGLFSKINTTTSPHNSMILLNWEYIAHSQLVCYLALSAWERISLIIIIQSLNHLHSYQNPLPIMMRKIG